MNPIQDRINRRIQWWPWASGNYVARLQLTPQEQDIAITAGLRLREASRSKGDQERKFSSGDGDGIQVHGSACEIGGCIFLGLDYEVHEGAYRRADLPYDIEIKGHTRGDYDCRIKPDEDNRHKVVMVILERLKSPLWIIGWIPAKEGKKFPQDSFDPEGRDGYKQSKPNHRVPQSKLRSIWGLRKWVMGKEGFWSPTYNQFEPGGTIPGGGIPLEVIQEMPPVPFQHRDNWPA